MEREVKEYHVYHRYGYNGVVVEEVYVEGYPLSVDVPSSDRIARMVKIVAKQKEPEKYKTMVFGGELGSNKTPIIIKPIEVEGSRGGAPHTLTHR